MIKARHHQQQPPRATACRYCAEPFNNPRRAQQHAWDKAELDDVHPSREIQLEHLQSEAA